MFLWQVRSLRSAAQWVDHTDRVIAQSRYVQKLIFETVTGIRGYFVTGEEVFLEPYVRAGSSLNQEFARLREMLADNPELLSSLDRIKSGFGAWYALANENIALKRRGVDVIRLRRGHPGKKILDGIQFEFDEFVNSELRLRDIRSLASQRTADQTTAVGLALALLFGVVIALHTRHLMLLLTRSYGGAIHELEQAVQSRDDFLSVASHELKTPLTSLELQLQMTDRAVNVEGGKAPSLPKLKKALGVCVAQSRRLANLVEELLDISRIHSDKLNLACENIDLAALLKQSVELYRAELAAANCALDVSISDSMQVVCDPFRMDQVVVNLLNNAMKYGAGKPVSVTLRQEGKSAVLIVKDSGIGIPPEKHEVIFERFERAVSPSNFGGLGLGLFIARQIVEAHHGSIKVESELGRGATFIVRLPLNAASS